MLHDAAAGGAEHAGAVGIVDIDHGVPPLGEAQQIGDRRDVAVLAEDAVGHDDLGCGRRPAQQRLEMIEVDVMIAVSPRAGQTHAFTNADVVIFVAEVRIGVFPARRKPKTRAIWDARGSVDRAPRLVRYPVANKIAWLLPLERAILRSSSP